MRMQLYRWGQPYFCYVANKEQVINASSLTMNRPWWWLRICGWRVAPERKP